MRRNGEVLDVWNGVVECIVISFICCKLPSG